MISHLIHLVQRTLENDAVLGEEKKKENSNQEVEDDVDRKLFEKTIDDVIVCGRSSMTLEYIRNE